MTGDIEIIARGVCVRDDQLLVCHNKLDDHVYLPGGHVEFVEETSESLRREIKEEMGEDADVKRFLGAIEHTFVQRGERRCEINLVFEMDVPAIDTSGHPPSCEEHIEFLWIPMEDLRARKLEPAVLQHTLGPWLKEKGETERWATA